MEPSYSWRCIYWRGARNRLRHRSSYDSGHINSGWHRWCSYNLTDTLVNSVLFYQSEAAGRGSTGVYGWPSRICAVLG